MCKSIRAGSQTHDHKKNLTDIDAWVVSLEIMI
jgi:hypothetical protein